MSRYQIQILGRNSKAHDEACAKASKILESAGVSAREALKEWKDTAPEGQLVVVVENGKRSFVKSAGRAGLLWQQVIESLPEYINGFKWDESDVYPA